MKPRDPSVDANAAVAFIRVVERGSFRAAADLLGVPRSTVSRRVAALEEVLGVRLLERTTRTLRLTDAGRAFAGEASSAVLALDSAVRAATEGAGRPSGMVRLTAPVLLGQLVLGEVLPQLLRAYSLIELVVELYDRVVNLVDAGFDLALRTGRLPPSSLVARHIGSTRIGIFASPQYLERRGRPRSPDELADHDGLLIGTAERQAPWIFTIRGRERRIKVPARAVVNDFLVLRALCAQGLGVARLPRPLAEPMLASGELVSLLEAFSGPPVFVQLVWPPGRKLPARTRVVIDLLAASLPRVLGEL